MTDDASLIALMEELKLEPDASRSKTKKALHERFDADKIGYCLACHEFYDKGRRHINAKHRVKSEEICDRYKQLKAIVESGEATQADKMNLPLLKGRVACLRTGKDLR